MVEVKRKIINNGTVDNQLNIIVGGKGPTTDRGYDDGETVVVAEAKKKQVETVPVTTSTAEAADEVYDDEPETPKDKSLEAILKNLKEHGRLSTGFSGEMLSIIAGKRVYGLLRAERFKAGMQLATATSEEDKLIKQKKFQQMSQMVEWASKNVDEVDNRINNYKESDNPRHVALAIDLEMAINIQEIKDANEQLRELQNKLQLFQKAKENSRLY
jgi:hypothetical protein